MEKRERFSPPAVGGSSLLVIFALLTLSVFALLSLSTVQAEARLAQTAARTAQSYYEADVQAEQILARLRRGEDVPGVEDSGGTYSYCCAISENQHLAVTVRVEDGLWEILSWQAVAAPEPAADGVLPVWDGSIHQEGSP